MSQKQRRDVSEKVVQRTESRQARLVQYNRRVGRVLLYILPLALIGLTATSILNSVQEPSFIDPLYLLYVFVILLLLFATNTFVLGLLAKWTGDSFQGRLDLERQRGRPLDSLHGFVTIRTNLGRTLWTIRVVFILSLVVLVLYSFYVYLAFEGSELSRSVAYLGLGLTLVCLGASLLVKSITMDVTSVTGLSDFYRPSSHELLLEDFFSDVFQGHLDPVARLKWDEFTECIRRCLRPDFVTDILQHESDESPVAFAVERLLYLHYLEYAGVLTHGRVRQELDEFLDLSREHYSPERGVRIGDRYYFDRQCIFDVFRLMEKTTPAFFDMIDRLQLELVDNITLLSQDPVYVDAAAQEVCKKDGECHLFMILFNNSPEERDYTVRVVATGLQPTELRVRVAAEGRGESRIPSEPIPLVSEGGTDVIQVVASILKNSVALWLTLEPREIGTQTLQVFVEDSAGRVIEGKTLTATVLRNTAYLLNRLTSGASIVTGSLTPVLGALPLPF
ncbi:MAG: hypothetical protein QXS20_08890 [Candidatus Thorarchaeota archaeon]